MLVVSRGEGEAVLIGRDIRIVVVRTGLHKIRLGIDAPRELNIAREEIDDGRTERQEVSK